jgi:hypothetical protein
MKGQPMFYNTIKTAWIAGKITVRPEELKPDRVCIGANGLLALKALLLTGTERRLLSELARFGAEFIAELPKDSDSWSREQRNLVVNAIHKNGIPRFPASMAKLETELPQRQYLS